jgi:two-component system, cell cycle response regulator
MLLPRRVLLADDDLHVRSGVEELLAPYGLEFVRAESGPEALEIARARLIPSKAPSRPTDLIASIDLMVLDLHMPGCTGIDVLTSLKSDRAVQRIPPCIFYSGEATEELRRRAFDAGAWAFLSKPVQPDLLRGEVLRALREVQRDLDREGPPTV